MSTRKKWEWVIRENVDEWGDADNLVFFDIKQLSQALEYMSSGDELQLYLRWLDDNDDLLEADYVNVDLDTMKLPNEMDGGSSIPKYIRKQLK